VRPIRDGYGQIVTDDTDRPSEDHDEETEPDAPLAQVIPFGHAWTRKARRAINRLGEGITPP